MPHYPLVHTDIDDPEVCEKCVASGSTYYKVIEGTTRCPRHGGAKQAISNAEKSATQYRVEVWNRRLKEFAGNDAVKSLREEIGVLRLLMEETLKRCSNADDLLMFSARIQSIANDIQRLVSSCDKLEKSMGEMMDRPTAIKFAGRLIEIVASEINDPDALDRISGRIVEIIQ